MGQTTSNEAAVELTDIPAIQNFQFEGDPVGTLKKSVNLFRGDVNLPLKLASLEADEGLSASVTAIYDGTSVHHVDVWNLDAPTGILGLGWSLPIEQVIASRSGAASDAATRYYLRASGAASELIAIGTDTDGAQLFQIASYQFWRIRYFEAQQRWEVTKEDGTTSIYGGSSQPGSSEGNSVQWGVALGNWMMASAETGGQTQIPTAWNLRQVVSTQGHAIIYTYDQVTQPVGNGGRAYTKACYLAAIADSTGRSITFVYGDKTYQAGQICEYQDPHKTTPNNNPDGYQSCYQTRYLDEIVVTAGDGTKISSVAFSYDFFNSSAGSDPEHAFLYKRILTAVHQRNGAGEPLPGMIFEYNDPGATAEGMLKQVTYPQGATATYGFSTVTLPSSRQQQINNPFTGSTPGVPRVWHGGDYTVVTWVDTAGKRLQVSTYSWSGTWVDWTPASFQSAEVDLSTLEVVTGTDHFAVFYRDLQSSQGVLLLYRRDPTILGTWTQTVKSIGMKTGSERASIAAGDDFVVVASPLFTAGAYLGAWWDWRQAAWTAPALPTVPLANPAQIAIAGAGNAYVVCSYTPGSQSGAFQLISLNDGQWTTRGWNATMDVFQGSDFAFTWNMLASGAVATYLSTVSETEATGRSLTYQWDTSFNPISPSSPVTADLTTPVTGGQMVVNILATVGAGATVANGASLSRFVGGGVANWATHALETQISADATYSFAYGADAGAMIKTAGGSSTATLSTFNPNVPNSGGWSQNIVQSQASAASIGDGIATLGTAIYQRQTNGNWIETGTLLAGQGRTVDPASVQNRGPDYLVYEDTGGANAITYFAPVLNGIVQQAISLAPTPQKVTVSGGGAGTNLAGPQTFVTYPAGSSFDATPYLTLYRVAQRGITGALSDSPVTTLSVTNGFDDEVNPTLVQAYRYSTAGMTFDTTSGLAQFPLVSMIPGTTDPGGATPFGRTDYYFSNGYSTVAQQFYSAGWVWNYSGLLNGSLLAVVVRDTQSTVVSTDVSWYQIYSATTDLPHLYGAYARPVKKTSLRDGVQSVADAQYDPGSGLRTTVTSKTYLGGSAERTYRQTTTYAFQVPAYASAMRAAWMLSPVAQVVTTCDGSPTVASAITYRNWSTDADPNWAALGSYNWLGSGDASFDFTAGASNPGWRCNRSILARAASGRIAARADAMGLVSSYLFDTSGHFQIAGFTNADVTQGEAGFAGFEPYDPLDAWTIGEGAVIVAGDAHTGTSALQIPAGATGLSAEFTAASGDMLLTAWVKTPQASSGAQWEVEINGTVTPVSIPDTAGVWEAIVARIPVAETNWGASATLRCVNGSSSAILVDDVRFGPFVGGFSARSLDMARRLVTARLDGALATRKFLYDDYGSKLATLGPGDAATAVQQLGTDVLSRETNGADTFSPLAPNAKVSVATMGASAYLDLASGTAVASQYSALPAAAWQVSGDQLVFAGGTDGSLTAVTGALAPPCTFRFTAAAAAPLQHPLTMGLTDQGTSSASVTFDPLTATYTLAVGGTVQASKTLPILSLPESSAASLDQGIVTSDIADVFTARGWPMTTAASVAVRTPGVSWTISQDGKVYYVTGGSGDLPVSVLPRAWMLVAGTKSLLFFADGIQLFGIATSATLTGLPAISLADPLVLSNLIILTRPLTSASYSDATGRAIQSLTLHDDSAIAQQTVYDSVGNTIASTKAASVPAAGRMLLGYAADFVTGLDPSTGVMTGLAADAFPESQGFPYSGVRYESSPLARPIETGKPGKDFAIDLSVPFDQRHTTRYAYGPNDSSSGLPANQYRTTTTISPRGARSQVYVDKTVKAQIGKQMGVGGSTLSTYSTFDAAGNVAAINTPNYYAPPAGTSASDWVMGFTYDTAGNILSQTTPDQGTTQFVYDPVGRLRFTCNAQAAEQGYIVYTKYDVLGRPVEVGTYETAFDRAMLQQKADTDPGWPDSANWQKRLEWDGDGGEPTTIGQIALAQTANATPGVADVTEAFGYDISGRVLHKASQVDGKDFAFAYAYDAYGSTSAITYPEDTGVGVVAYAQDDMARIIGLGTPDDSQAYSAYRYGPDGSIDTETFQPDSALPINRVIAHNSPGWISGITARTADGTEIFDEALSYTSGGWPNGEGWYDGSIAQIDFAYAGVEGDYSYRINYDDQGQISAAKDDASDQYDFGIAQPVTYDANGNILGSSVGTVALDYSYAPGSGDRLQTITASDPNLERTYHYDAAGNVTGIAGGRDLTIAYDRATSLPATVTAPNATVGFAYDGSGRRIAKRSQGAPKVYGYGTSQQPLVEWGGVGQGPTSYIYGPAGLAAVSSGNGLNFVFRDHERSPRVLCGPDGAISASFDYLPFGKVARENGDTSLIDRRFTGQEFDAETGLYNYGSRLYDADVGRFLAPDPKHQFFSPYLYAANNPLSFVDPTGQFAVIAALVEGLADLIAVSVASAETAEVAVTATTVTAEIAEGTEAVAVGTEAVTTSIATATTEESVAASETLVATSSESVTTSLSEASTLGTESAEVESGSFSSLDSSSQAITRQYNPSEWMRFRGDLGGETDLNPQPWTRWPMTYLNNLGLQSYDPIVTNFDVPGTFGRIDTAFHEGFHAAVARYLPFVTWIEEAPGSLLGFRTGAPVLWAEETMAYSIGHLAAGRILAVPLAPLEAFGSLGGYVPDALVNGALDLSNWLGNSFAGLFGL